MSVATLSAPSGLSGTPPFPVYRISVDRYHAMIQGGVFDEDDAVELLEGWIVEKMPRNPVHDGAIALVDGSLRPLLPGGWHIRIQSAITTPDSEPEPDLAVVMGDVRTYLNRHPGPSDILGLIEVSETSLQHDRLAKARIYARAGIAHYWVINLVDGQVEAFSDPDSHANPPTYRQAQVYLGGQTIPLVLNGQLLGQIAVQDLLP